MGSETWYAIIGSADENVVAAAWRAVCAEMTRRWLTTTISLCYEDREDDPEAWEDMQGNFAPTDALEPEVFAVPMPACYVGISGDDQIPGGDEDGDSRMSLLNSALVRVWCKLDESPRYYAKIDGVVYDVSSAGAEHGCASLPSTMGGGCGLSAEPLPLPGQFADQAAAMAYINRHHRKWAPPHMARCEGGVTVIGGWVAC